MVITLFKGMIVTVSFFILVTFFILRIKPINDFVYNNRKQLSHQIIFSVVFGIIGIICTYTGTKINGAIANTRAISMVASGLLGGPVVGVASGIIAGIHRYAMDVGGFTATACAVSTIVEGLAGGILHHVYTRTRYKSEVAFCTALGAEILQMLIILAIARPFEDAWALVKLISLPMVILNSIGVTILMSIFEYVAFERDIAAARRTKQALVIADKCLPYFKKGLEDEENLQMAADVIASIADVDGVAITDCERCLISNGVVISGYKPLPDIITETMRTGKCMTLEMRESFITAEDPLCAIAAPLSVQGEVVGCLVLFVNDYGRANETELSFVSGLATLFSTQLELGKAEYQKSLLQKAEFQALQSQINPHFFFNSLNTIAAFCREKPAQARELLLALSDYFRRSLDAGEYMINLEEELQFVEAYLQLEKARFEEKLKIEIDIPDDVSCTVPRLILQPIVENAVKHGIVNGTGSVAVSIAATKDKEGTHITVRDTGLGIPETVLSDLYSNIESKSKSIGLFNVHNRLKSIYGDTNGLEISSADGTGTCVTINIPVMGGARS